MSQQIMTSIADAISVLHNPYPPVNLIKHYKGTTLNQQGHILSIDPDLVTIQATKRLTFPVLDGTIHLRSKVFEGAISATIHPVDYAQGTFQLSNLNYGEWQERKAERVQPKNPTYVAMNFVRKTYRGFLSDISTDGVGILTNKTMNPGGRLRIGENLLLEFQISPEHKFTNLKSMVVYRQKVGRDLVKFGLSLFPDAYQKTTLQDYILQRHEEILTELKKDYQRMREPCHVENLYF